MGNCNRAAVLKTGRRFQKVVRLYRKAVALCRKGLDYYNQAEREYNKLPKSQKIMKGETIK